MTNIAWFWILVIVLVLCTFVYNTIREMHEAEDQRWRRLIELFVDSDDDNSGDNNEDNT